MQMDRKTVEEAKKQIEKDLQELQLMFMRNERDLLTMRVQHLKEENDKLGNAENAFNEKVISILMKELDFIEKDVDNRVGDKEHDGIVPRTPMSRMHSIVITYKLLTSKGGNGNAYPTGV